MLIQNIPALFLFYKVAHRSRMHFRIHFFIDLHYLLSSENGGIRTSNTVPSGRSILYVPLQEKQRKPLSKMDFRGPSKICTFVLGNSTHLYWEAQVIVVEIMVYQKGSFQRKPSFL